MNYIALIIVRAIILYVVNIMQNITYRTIDITIVYIIA